MESQEIEQYLRELGDELGRRKIKEPIKVLMIGGGYMLTQFGNRKFTEDIDFFPLNFELSTQPSKYTKQLQNAAKVIRKRYNLTKDWINDIAATMLGGLGPAEPEIKLWATFNKLHVYIPDHPEYILALKLFAGRKRDENDIEVLCKQLGIQTRQQAQIILNKYIYLRWQIEHRVAGTLKHYFPE